MREAIEEVAVVSIEIAASSTYNRSYTPSDGKVKWFYDEHGKHWVKFKTNQVQNHTHVGYVQYVVPAHRVVCVVYHKPLSEETA